MNFPGFDEISWHADALAYAEMYGLTKEDVEKIIISRSSPVIDPRSHEAGHLIMRYRAGDVVVVVGHRDKKRPMIMSVWVETNSQRSGTKKQSGVSGSSMPKSMKEIQKRIMADGFTIKHSSHLRVEDSEGVFVYSLPSTPSEYRSIANSWKGYLRAKAAYLQRKQDEE